MIEGICSMKLWILFAINSASRLFVQTWSVSQHSMFMDSGCSWHVSINGWHYCEYFPQLIFTAHNEVGARLYFHRRQWFCPRGEGGRAWPGGVCVAGGGVCGRGIRSMSGRHASYWNAFLLVFSSKRFGNASLRVSYQSCLKYIVSVMMSTLEWHLWSFWELIFGVGNKTLFIRSAVAKIS